MSYPGLTYHVHPTIVMIFTPARTTNGEAELRGTSVENVAIKSHIDEVWEQSGGVRDAA